MRPLDANDFRARRLVLEPDDFALGPDTDDPSPADLIDKETWESMVSLPDDVSVRTSNNYGKVLRVLWSYWDEWNCLTGALQLGAHSRPIARVAGDSSDELQASIFCSLIGYYRVAFSCLRNVIEQMTIGLELELSGDHSLFRDWVDGQKELKLGWAADLLPRSRAVSVLEIHLKSTVHDDLFGQESKDRRPAGFVRRLFSEVSKFTHGYPGFTDSDMRKAQDQSSLERRTNGG